MKRPPGTSPERPLGRTARLATVLLLAASVIVALILGELTVRAFIPVRNIGPTFSEYDPVYGKRLKKSFSCTRTAAEFTMRFTTNSLGFRGVEPPAFPEGGILFLGDSFTSGYGVNDGEEYPALLADAIRGLPGGRMMPVVNAGTGNTGNGYWLRFLRHETDRFRPRLVVFGFCGNDFLDNAVEQMYRLGPDGGLRESGAPPRQETARTAQLIIEAIPGLAYSHLVGLARQFFSEGGAPVGGSGDHATADSLTYALLREVFTETRKRDLPAVLLLVEVDTLRAAAIGDLARAFGIPVLRAPSKRVRPDLYYTIDGHWNAAGHREIAARLLPVLRTRLASLSEEITRQ